VARLLDGLLNYSSTLKMEAICSSEMSGATQWTTRRHIPEDDTLHYHDIIHPCNVADFSNEKHHPGLHYQLPNMSIFKCSHNNKVYTSLSIATL
jgi:hypothetical protein